MNDIIDLGARRKPVVFTVVVTHHWDGTLSMSIHDVADDPRSKYAAGEDLYILSEKLMNEAESEGYVPESDGS